ncbi:MAG: murein transglycosylase A [Sphingomonadaceae bacterium]
MKRIAAGLATAFLLAGCRVIPGGEAPRPVGQAKPPAGAVASAAFAGVVRGPSVGALLQGPGRADTALAAFRESCHVATRRPDASGLTYPEDWVPACEAARAWPVSRARQFFIEHFETARVGTGEAFATGYYEPEIAGSRTRRPGYEVPVHALPPDLERGWHDETPLSERTGRPPLSRKLPSGKFVPYYERSEIDAGALAGRGLELAWAADPVELFFLQIQGSGRLVTPEGQVIRIGYAGQNGREYVAIGRILRERGVIGTGPGQYPGTMQGLMAWIRDNPEEGRKVMHQNRSYVFFRELTGDGPLGSIGVPVRREASVAVDPAFVPYGAPVWLDLDRAEANGLWVAQDTGGAIKGANRFDTFWGAGEDARVIAGGMSARGTALVLLPKGTVARLSGE